MVRGESVPGWSRGDGRDAVPTSGPHSSPSTVCCGSRSTVLIDYLDARDEAVAYVERHLEERAVTIPLVVFEVYRGEVFETGAPDFDAVDDALEWVAVVDETRTIARAAAELQQALARSGTPLAARDTFVAGAASGLDERLVVADADFDVPELTEEVDVDVDLLPERG